MQVVNGKAQAKSAPAMPGTLAGELYPASHPYEATLTDQRIARNFFILNRFIAEPAAVPVISSPTFITTSPGGRLNPGIREGRPAAQ
jgi:hypothetical protein